MRTVATIMVSDWPMVGDACWPSQTCRSHFPNMVLDSLFLHGLSCHSYNTVVAGFDAVGTAEGTDDGYGLVVKRGVVLGLEAIVSNATCSVSAAICCCTC